MRKRFEASGLGTLEVASIASGLERNLMNSDAEPDAAVIRRIEKANKA